MASKRGENVGAKTPEADMRGFPYEQMWLENVAGLMKLTGACWRTCSPAICGTAVAIGE